MGFFDKLTKALPYIERGAVIAGQAKDNPVGAALAAVQFINDRGASSRDASVALAVAVDDIEARLVAVEKELKAQKAAAKKGTKK